MTRAFQCLLFSIAVLLGCFPAEVARSQPIDYFEIKSSVGNDFVSWIDIFEVPGNEFFDENGRFREDLLGVMNYRRENNEFGYNMDMVQGGVPLTSCGVQLGYSSQLFGNQNFMNIVESPVVERNEIIGNYYDLASTIFEVKSALSHYELNQSRYIDQLIEFEQTMLDRADLNYKIFKIELMIELSEFAESISIENGGYGTRFGATHGCGGGQFAISVRVEPPESQIQIISKILYDDCARQNAGAFVPENCSGFRENLRDEEIVDLSGIYMFREAADLSAEFASVNVNRYLRSRLARYREALRTGDFDQFGIEGDLCFSNGDIVSCE